MQCNAMQGNATQGNATQRKGNAKGNAKGNVLKHPSLEANLKEVVKSKTAFPNTP